MYYQSRSITYKLDGLDVTPLIKCLILSYDLNGEYSTNELSLYSPFTPIRTRYSEISMHTYSGFDPGIFGSVAEHSESSEEMLPARCSNGLSKVAAFEGKAERGGGSSTGGSGIKV